MIPAKRTILWPIAVLIFICVQSAHGQCSASKPCATGCCSKFGGCGFGDDYCSPANCVGTCDAQPQCSATKPCEVGCCSKYGNCGFGSDFCGPDCVGTCDAKSECGENAAAGKEKCPLNVCCSKFGFCGTTSEFCSDGCQNGCDMPSPANCGGASADRRTIGYYESWSYKRTCDSWAPEDLYVDLLTHVNFAFALVGPDNRIATANSYDADLYGRTTNLKTRDPALKVFISVGGWDAGTEGFSRMASSAGSRATFIESVKAFLVTYGFDGIDIDWEYPVADDRGGKPEDMQNYVSLLKEMRSAFGSIYGITVAIPNSYWYLRGFDVSGMAKYVDWFNVMSYDIHGTWDGKSKYTQPLAQPHTNITEVSQGLDLLWRNNVPRSKVVMGLAFYGRTFTLKDPACNTPGCEFRSGAEPGPCTGTSGVLSNSEIYSIIRDKNLQPVFDEKAFVKYVAWDNDQWASFDDAETFELKKAWANSQCLGGVMIWALSQDSPDYASLMGLAASIDGVDPNSPLSIQAQLVKKAAIDYQNKAGLLMFWSDCAQDPKCPPGFQQLTTVTGWVSSVFGNECENRERRAMCVESDVVAQDCYWYGGHAPRCAELCPDGSVQLAYSFDSRQDAFPHRGDPSRNSPHCSVGIKSFCCKAIGTSDLQNCEMGDITGLFGAGAGSGIAGDIGRVLKRFQDIGGGPPVNDGGGPSSQGEENDYWPPENCAWQRGNLQLGTPNPGSFLALLPGVFLPNPAGGGGRNLPFIFQRKGSLVRNPLPGNLNCQITSTRHIDTTTMPMTTRTCPYDPWGQACYNYASVAKFHSRSYATLTCPVMRATGGRTAPRKWDAQHNKEWRSWIPELAPGLGYCQRDEYPFFAFMGTGNNYYQWIRLIPSRQNGGAGQIASGVCPSIASHTKISAVRTVHGINGLVTCLETTTSLTTRSRLFIQQVGLSDLNGNQGLGENPCTPFITNDVGYPLFTNDDYYVRNGLARPNYATVPASSLTSGKVKPTPNGGFQPHHQPRAEPAPPASSIPDRPEPQNKLPPPQRQPRSQGSHNRLMRARSQGPEPPYGDMFEMLEHVTAGGGGGGGHSAAEEEVARVVAELGLGVDDGNSTRRPTAKELREEFGLFRCRSENCVLELAAVGRDVHGRVTAQSAPAAQATGALLETDAGSDGAQGRTVLAALSSTPPAATATPTTVNDRAASHRDRRRQH